MHVPGTQAGMVRDCVGERNQGAVAIPVELPAVERTFEQIADHPAAIPQMRAEMRAMPVEQRGYTVGGAGQHEIDAERVKRHNLLPFEFVAVGDAIPAAWERREREAVGQGPSETWLNWR